MRRIAFIGGGPKALFALLELHERCLDAAPGELHVDVFDPFLPGAGRVWQAGQPSELRLNVSARIVDASSPVVAGSETFGDWVARSEPRYARSQYPPRAVVGRYLREQFLLLARAARFTVVHVRARVTAVVRAGQRWELSSDAGPGFYDEVVLATGHGLPGDGAATVPASAVNRSPLIGQYMVLEEPRIPAGSHVLIRGAALSAYDAVLLLTEGRGGRFQQIEAADGPWLEYVSSGNEPAKITMASRSALAMDPKPEQVPAWVRPCIDAYREQITQWSRDLAVRTSEHGAEYNGLWRILLACAGECAALCDSPLSPGELWRAALTGGETAGPGNESPAEHMARTIRMNRGNAAPGAGWLLARVWSGLYPEIVQAVSRVHWRPGQVRSFARVSRALERMAFGPPEPTALKLLALFDSGLLEQGAFPAAPPPDRILLDAVTPPAGVLATPAPAGRAMSPVIAALMAAGELTVREGERGLLTDRDGTCIDAQGDRNESLSALGRLTEGPTLGHDTLNRTLHAEPRLWARRIALQRTPQHSGKRT